MKKNLVFNLTGIFLFGTTFLSIGYIIGKKRNKIDIYGEIVFDDSNSGMYLKFGSYDDIIAAKNKKFAIFKVVNIKSDLSQKN